MTPSAVSTIASMVAEYSLVVRAEHQGIHSMTGNHSHHKWQPIMAWSVLAARCGEHFAVIQGNFGVAIVTLGNGDV